MSNSLDASRNITRLVGSLQTAIGRLEDLSTQNEVLTPEQQEQIRAYESEIDDRARLLCILISGFLEVSVREVVEEHFYNVAPDASRYVQETWPRSRNMWFDVIVAVAKNINELKGNEFREENRQTYKDSIDQIITARNKISHGIQYMIVAEDVIEWHAKSEDIMQNFKAMFSRELLRRRGH